ncbi:hypothetical protein B0T21DRAFT_343261 [Apiosordaria backusii]|uniref:Uncharacterized protein n=1 Tax=Apiosordaria backusii TaxID=314023 RepID=A0AA40K680_9PEZI|nr:hypothetical protein B0T21DRAFT_343261 [Apiosordaria backusii]
MAHAMRAIAQLRAVRGPGALSISPSVSAERARTIPANIRTFTVFTSPASSTPLRPGTRLLQQRLNVTTQPQNRSFSVVSYFDTAIHTTQDYLLFLHSSLGIPWYLAIPLFAISLNMLLRLPSQLYIHDLYHRRAKLNPLNKAFMRHEYVTKERGKNNKLDQSLKQIPVLAHNAHNKFLKRWKLQPWRAVTANLANFPLWLLGIEAIRRQSTATGGLLGTILDWFREKKTAEIDPVELANSAIKRAPPAPLDGPVLDSTMNEAISQAGEVGQHMASSVANTMPAMEGILWIPDLALADPYYILPFTLSAALVANQWPKNSEQWRRLLGGTAPIQTDPDTPSQARFKQRLMLAGARLNLLFSILVGPLTIGLPAAMHLYWITTTMVTPILRKGLVMVWPVRKPMMMIRMRPESHLIYPDHPEPKQQSVPENTTVKSNPPVVAAAAAVAVPPSPAVKRTAPVVKPTAAAAAPPTKPATSPAKPASRFTAKGNKQEKTAKR